MHSTMPAILASQDSPRHQSSCEIGYMVSRIKLLYNCARHMIQDNTPAPKEDSMHRTVSVAHLSTAVILGLWLCTQLTSLAMAQDRVRAKVGIQVRSGERTAPAKTTETGKTGDSLRVYVVPEDNAYVYVVHNDGKTLTLLNAQNATTKVTKGELVALPALEQFYQINGGSDRESITVICSSTEIREIASLVSAP